MENLKKSWAARRVYVLYHANCPDGFAAAAVCWLLMGDAAEYVPVAYGEPLPDLEPDSAVYIVDFSYGAEVLLELAGRMAMVVVLDHHKTAREALAGLVAGGPQVPWNLRVVFDLEKCGAVLAWEWFYGEQAAAPMFLRYIEDRDLWRWALPESREVSAGLLTLARELPVWAERLKCEGVRDLVEPGRVILMAQERVVRGICKRAWLERICGHEVPVVNTSAYHSECCHELLRAFPESPFAASYFDDGARRRWSLRSRRDFDCSVVARALGGGGHAQACGFEADLPAVIGGAAAEVV